MKTRKVLALVLSLVMVFSLCSSAFAAHLTDEVTELESSNSDISMELATQGYILLENNGVLPLNKADYNNKVALFGSASENTIKGGTGSGDVNQRSRDNIDEALIAAGWEIANTTWMAKMEKQAVGGGCMGAAPKVDMEITDEEMAEAKAADLAVYAIARNAGEGADRKIDSGDGQYTLTDIEKANIAKITANFENVVVVFNTCVIDSSWVGEYLADNGIDAIVYMSNGGQRGSEALVKVLEGEVTPSGKLTDTWPVSVYDYPSTAGFAGQDGNTKTEVYNEGIYVGYRYFDTYGKDVTWEFGYGMSYTTFDIEVVDVKADANEVEVDVVVTNTGDTYSGKEVVEVYFSAPDGKLDKPYQELAAYGKTDELAPGASQTMKITYATTDMSSYDEALAAYVMEDGEYIVRVGNSSRNTHVAAVVTIAEDVITEQLSNQVVPEIDYDYLDGSDATPITYEGEKEEIAAAKRIAVSGIVTVNNASKYDDETVTTYLFAEDQANYIARDEITLQTKSVSGILSNVENPDPAKPQMGYCTTTYKEVVEIVDALPEGITKANAKLTDVYNGKITMEQFVACLSADEMARLCVGGAGTVQTNPDGTMIGGSASSVQGGAGQTTQELYQTRHIPSMPNADGPAGIRITQNYTSNGVRYYQFCTAFPAGTCMAQTWDADAIYAEGVAVGSEMKEYGVTTWLAPGMDIHRHALGGRNFEYYSEDPLVSGISAAYVTMGVQSHSGIGVTLKHYWGNEQEDNRNALNNVISERSAREIYLKQFEIAVKLARPQCIMTCYNENNGWPGADSWDSCTDLARGEWGFTGYIMTDWGGGQSTQYISMHAGNDMIMPGGNSSVILNGYAYPSFNADGSIKRAGGFKLNADGETTYKVATTATRESDLPASVQTAIDNGQAEYVRKGNTATVTYYGDLSFAGQGRGTIALGDLQKSTIAILNVDLQSQDMEKMLADDLFGIDYTAGSYSANNGALISEGWTMCEKGKVAIDAVKIEKVNAIGDEAEVGVYYLGAEEISSILLTIDSGLAIKSVKTQDGATVVNNNGKVVVWTTGTLDTSKPVLTIVVDTADAKAGTYAITGTVEQMINSDAELIATVPVIAGAVTVTVAGDVDGDGIVTTTDLVMIARYLVDLEELTAEQLVVADVDGDGFVTASDLVSIARSIVA